MDAGADTTTAIRVTDAGGVVLFEYTPLALAETCVGNKKVPPERTLQRARCTTWRVSGGC